MTDSELAKRMFQAVNALEQRLQRRVTLEQLGVLIAKRQGEPKAYAASVVGRWINGEQAPRTRETWRAVADTLGVDPGWLTYGTGSMVATSPSQPNPATDYKATPDDFAADRAELAERAKRQAAPKPAKRGGRGR